MTIKPWSSRVIKTKWVNRLVVMNLCVSVAFIVWSPWRGVAQSPKKMWSIDLARDKDFAKRLNVDETLLTPPTVSFLSNGKILCGFYDGDKLGANPYGARTRSRGYHVLELDGDNGSFGPRLDLLTYNDNSKALPLSNGGFAVLAHSVIQEFDVTFAPGPQYPQVAGNTDGYGIQFMDVAPSQNIIVAYEHELGRNLAKWTWLRAKDLSVISTRMGGLASIIEALDDSVIYDADAGRARLSTDGPRSICKMCRTFVLSGDMLFVDLSGGKVNGKYSLQTMAGKSVGMGTLDSGATDFTRAANAFRCAFLTGSNTTRSQLEDATTSARIVVLDWQKNKLVA